MADQTQDHELALPPQGTDPWGEQIRENFRILDQAVPYVRAQMWRFGNGTVTAIPGSQQYVTANVPDTQGLSPCECVTFPQANRLRYEQGHPRTLNVSGTVTLDPAGNNKVFRTALFRRPDGGDWALVEPSQARVRIGAGGDIESVALFGLVDVVPGDELEVRVGNWTDSTDVTVVDLSLLLRG